MHYFDLYSATRLLTRYFPSILQSAACFAAIHAREKKNVYPKIITRFTKLKSRNKQQQQQQQQTISKTTTPSRSNSTNLPEPARESAPASASASAVTLPLTSASASASQATSTAAAAAGVSHRGRADSLGLDQRDAAQAAFERAHREEMRWYESEVEVLEKRLGEVKRQVRPCRLSVSVGRA